MIAWNKYYGWYGGTWADKEHTNFPNTPIGISEYEARASIEHQNENLVKTNPRSYWHPENWQTEYHEVHWEEIDKRPFIWGTFIWNLFDFEPAHRTEGEKDGKNDKGIVSFDRKDKKDTFYFYKANWNPKEPMVYIAERRLAKRTNSEQTIKVYSNQNEVTLLVNGKEFKPNKLGTYARFYFKVKLQQGRNEIVARTDNGLEDSIFVELLD